MKKILKSLSSVLQATPASLVKWSMAAPAVASHQRVRGVEKAGIDNNYIIGAYI